MDQGLITMLPASHAQQWFIVQMVKGWYFIPSQMFLQSMSLVGSLNIQT